MKLIDRYVLFESLQLMIIGAVAIIGIFLGTAEFQNYLHLINHFGLPLNIVLSVILLQIPAGLVFSLPAAVLFSTMLMIIRQHNDSELVVLQTCGVRLHRIMMPYMALGLVAGILTFAINEKVAPETSYLSKKITLLGIYKSGSPFYNRAMVEGLNREGQVDQVWMFGNTVEGVKNGFIAFDLRTKGIVKLVWANRASWEKGAWILSDGSIYELFDQYKDGLRGSFSAMHYTNKAMVDAIKMGPISNWSKTAEQIVKEIQSFKEKNMILPPELMLLLHRRYAHPASCFLVVFATLPVALLRRRRSRSAAYIYAALLITSFFLVQQICIALAENGRMDAIIAAWLPGTLLGLTGIALALVLKDR